MGLGGGSRRAKFSDYTITLISMIIWEFLHVHPLATLSETLVAIRAEGIDCRSSYLSNLFKKWGWSWKQPVVQQMVSSSFKSSGTIPSGFFYLLSLSTPPSPQQKFSPANVERYLTFSTMVLQIDPARIVYVDEAHFVSRRLHRNKAVGPIGKKAFIVRDSSIRGDDNVTLTLATSLTHSSPVWGATTAGSNDSVNFWLTINQMIISGILCQGKVLILDNAHIHTSQPYLSHMLDLFDELGIVLRLQPCYSPEFNAWLCFSLIFFQKNFPH